MAGPDVAALSATDYDHSDGYAALPHNLEVEQALLGALLFNNETANQVPFLAADHFYDPLHQRIFETVLRLIERITPTVSFG